jgi:hypothetical protein
MLFVFVSLEILTISFLDAHYCTPTKRTSIMETSNNNNSNNETIRVQVHHFIRNGTLLDSTEMKAIKIHGERNLAMEKEYRAAGNPLRTASDYVAAIHALRLQFQELTFESLMIMAYGLDTICSIFGTDFPRTGIPEDTQKRHECLEIITKRMPLSSDN